MSFRTLLEECYEREDKLRESRDLERSIAVTFAIAIANHTDADEFADRLDWLSRAAHITDERSRAVYREAAKRVRFEMERSNRKAG